MTIEINKDKKEKIIAGKNQILSRWRKYFYELVSGNDKEDQEEMSNLEQVDINQKEDEANPPDKDEIEMIIKNFKNNKSPGSDGISPQMFKVLS